MSVICPYCSNPAILVGGDWIYPHRPDLAHKRFWLCADDSAWVGCHGNSDKPLGRLANAELRQAKMDAHAAFDPIWQGQRKVPKTGIPRPLAYLWLAQQLGIDRNDCHIGMFDVETCRRVVEVCNQPVSKQGQ